MLYIFTNPLIHYTGHMIRGGTISMIIQPGHDYHVIWPPLPGGQKLAFLHYKSFLKSASNGLKFDIDLVHRIIRPTVKKLAQSDCRFNSYSIFGPFFQKCKNANFWPPGRGGSNDMIEKKQNHILILHTKPQWKMPGLDNHWNSPPPNRGAALPADQGHI